MNREQGLLSQLPYILYIIFLALYPGPTQPSVACSTEKQGEPVIFSHVSDVTTNKKLMNVGRLKHNSAIVPAKMVREFVCFEQSFATSVQSVCFCRWLKTEKHEQIAGDSSERKPALPLYTSFCVESKRLFVLATKCW